MVVSCVPLPLLLSLLVVVTGHTASAAPCPYNASVDLDSLLSLSQTLRREADEQQGDTSPPIRYPTYGHCDPFYEGDIFLNGMEPWADEDREPGHMTPEVQLWPEGVVYYTTAVNNLNVQHFLNISLSDLETRTATEAGPCLRFVPWSPGVSEDFLFITDTLSNCCFSGVGRHGGNQSLNVGMNGNNVGNIKHLLMHALGFWHEHSRPGRDADIEVLWENVEEGLQCFFDEYRNETEFVEEVPYDLTSVTHISLDTWRKEYGLNTLQPRTPTNDTGIGFKQKLSDLDIQRIRTRYSCPVPDVTTTSQPTTAEPPASTTPTTARTTTYLPPRVVCKDQPGKPETTTYLPPRVVCKDQPDGRMLPYADDCHKFYKCDGGRDYVCCCPLPLVFSAEEATCDYPWKVPCDNPDRPSECPDHSVPDPQQCRYTQAV